MKITVIGPGAMGLLFGGKLAACADVSLIGSNAANLEKINKEGVTIKRGDSSVTRMVPAYMAGTCTEPVDVVMIFTKAYQIRDVLTQNRALIGPDTLLLTLTKGEDGTYTVTNEKHAADGEDYAESLEALCEEVGIPVDDVRVASKLGAYNDADALAKYLNEHPEIATAEYQGEQMTAEELKALSDGYTSDLMDSIFEETEE